MILVDRGPVSSIWFDFHRVRDTKFNMPKDRDLDKSVWFFILKIIFFIFYFKLIFFSVFISFWFFNIKNNFLKNKKILF
jgi:hypothetical protein